MRSYEEILELGRGGMGVVFLACGRGAGGFENLVVLKRLHAELTSDKKSVERFLHEAKVAALIHHANVVGTHYVGEDEKGYFLVIDYVEGLSLDELMTRALARRSRLPPAIVLRVALDALSGLSAVHEASDPTGRRLNLLHRDISPHNLLVGRDGVTRVADFGIARSNTNQTTKRDYLLGKVCYLTREYLRRQDLTASADVYALAVSIWTTLAGHEPWPEADEAQTLRAILDERLPPLSTEAEVSAALDTIVQFGTEPEREGRYQTARQMADAIEAAAAQGERIATAREVAELVEQLAGEELAARTQRVAAWFSGHEMEVTERRAAPHSARAAKTKIALAALIVLGAGAAAAFVTLRGPRATGPSSSPSAQSAPSAAPPLTSAIEPSVTPERALAVEPAPLAVQPSAIPAAPRSVPSDVPSDALTERAIAARRAPTKTGTMPEPLPTLPSKIVTKNPYRK